MTFDAADEVIAELTKLANDKDNVYRGYSKQDQLLPSLFRDKSFVDREIGLLSDFEKYGLQYFSVNSVIDFVSYGQHFGLPTRLLDFTYNPFVALFFALYKKKGTKYIYEEDMEYYYIRYCNLNEQIVINVLPVPATFNNVGMSSESLTFQYMQCVISLNRLTDCLNDIENDEKDKEGIIHSFFKIAYRNKLVLDNDLDTYCDDNFKKLSNKRILFVDANQCNSRIVMQQGLFMLPYNIDEKEHLSIIENNTNLIRIHKNIRKELLDYLETIGIDSYRLMPDLQSVCEAIKSNGN